MRTEQTLDDTLREILLGSFEAPQGEPYDASAHPLAVGELLFHGLVTPDFAGKPDIVSAGMGFKLTSAGRTQAAISEVVRRGSEAYRAPVPPTLPVVIPHESSRRH